MTILGQQIKNSAMIGSYNKQTNKNSGVKAYKTEWKRQDEKRLYSMFQMTEKRISEKIMEKDT